MLEYNLTPTEQFKTAKPSLSKKCLCWHSDVMFDGREESGGTESLNTFQREFEDRLDQGLIGHEVCNNDDLILL